MLYTTTFQEDQNHLQSIENQSEEWGTPSNTSKAKRDSKENKPSSQQIRLIDQIHSHAVEAANQFRKCESHIIEALEQVEKNKVHLHHGFSSLFQYAVHCLKLAENTAYILITVMRKSREVPSLKKEISNGNISISNARRIASVITSENQTEWLQKAATLSQRQLEKEIASTHPLQSVPERTKYISQQRLKLELGISETHLLKVRRAQDLISKAKSKHVSMEETLIELTEYFLHHKDPTLKAKRIISKKGVSTNIFQTRNEKQKSLPNKGDIECIENTNSNHSTLPARLESSDELNSSTNIRTPIPAAILHQINLRDQGKCTHLRPGGQKCNHSRWTEIHHITPIAHGGSHSLENLTTLCSAHHRWIHRK